MSDDILTGDNWKRFAKAAVDELPEEVSDSVGWGESKAGAIEISIAVAPENQSHSTIVRRIRIDSVGGEHPYVQVAAKGAPGPSPKSGQFHLEFADTDKYRRYIQMAILGELCRGGIIEREGDDATIRYVSKNDGSTIVEWRT